MASVQQPQRVVAATTPPPRTDRAGNGDPGLSYAEARSHFGAWCVVSSPLILSHDVTNATTVQVRS